MSTKNLSRTVLEGGRSFGNRYDRRRSNGDHRVKSRQSLSTASCWDDDSDWLAPSRRHVGRVFQDKLKPAERWMTKQVGRPWDLVRSELTSRFDTRTVAGRHIVVAHLLRDVLEAGALEAPYRYARFYVDARGLLKKRPRWRQPCRLA